MDPIMVGHYEIIKLRYDEHRPFFVRDTRTGYNACRGRYYTLETATRRARDLMKLFTS